jgi:uncharacterized protein YjiS (DUF1127 family)
MQSAQCCIAAIRVLLEPLQHYVRCRIAGEFAPALKRLTIMFLTHLVGVYRQWRRYNQSLRELNRLGDRELADIGITRGDIPRVALESSER